MAAKRTMLAIPESSLSTSPSIRSSRSAIRHFNIGEELKKEGVRLGRLELVWSYVLLSLHRGLGLATTLI